MKKLGKFALGILFSLSLASQLSAAPQFGGDRRGRQGSDSVCLYKDIHYQGVEQCFRDGETISTLQGFNHQVSSIRVYGRTSVTVYDSTNFRGHSATFTTSMPDLGQARLDNHTWSDRIESLQIGVDNRGYGTSGNGPVYGGSQGRSYPYPNQQISEGICVYDRPNFQGRSECWNASEQLSDLGRIDRWNDRISSIRVFGRTSAVAYRDVGFRGASMVVNRDIPDLARNWDHQISSLRIENGRENSGSGRYGRTRQRY